MKDSGSRKFVGSILVYRTGQLGDTLIALPAIYLIHKQYPNHRLVLMTERQPATHYVSSWNVLGPTGWFDQVIFYRSAHGLWRQFINLVTLAWKLRRLHFDMVYDLSPERTLRQSQRDRVFFKWIAGIRDYRGGGYLAKPAKLDNGILPRIEPEWRRLLRAIEAPNNDETSFRLKIPEEDRRKTNEQFARAGITDVTPLIAIGAGSKMPAKIWPLTRFKELGQRLLERYPDHFLIIVGGDDDTGSGNMLCQAWGGRAYNFAGLLSPYGSAEILRRCLIYIGNDTGAMHLAGMVGTPCVALFSARDYPGQWEPYGSGHQILRRDIECAGCMHEICPYDNKCLSLISVDEVENAVNAVIERRPATLRPEIQ